MAHVLGAGEREAVMRSRYDSRPLFLALHTANPGPSGGHEVSGRPYQRQEITWRVEGPLRSNAADIRFVVPACQPSWLGIWDAPSGGRFVTAGDTPEPKEGWPADRDTYRVPAGTVTVSVV